MKAEELRKIKNDSYDKWFERWFEKENLPEKLKQAAMMGRNNYTYELNGLMSGYEINRMNDEQFVKKLKEKLPYLSIRKTEPVWIPAGSIIPVKKVEYPKITISWR